MTPSDLAELQFFPALFGSILTEGVSDRRDADAIACGAGLEASYRAPAVFSPPKLKSRSAGLLRAAVAAFRAPLISEGAAVALAGLIADRLLGEIVGSGYLVLHPGSDFDRSLSLIRNGLVDVVDEGMRSRAEEEWPAALERVKWAGLFGGVQVVEVEAAEMARAA